MITGLSIRYLRNDRDTGNNGREMEIIRERIKWWSPWGERKFSRNARRRGAGKLPAHAQESERGSGEAVSVGRISMTNTGRNRRADADPICILSQQINGPACNAPTRDDVRVRTRYFPARNAPIGLERAAETESGAAAFLVSRIYFPSRCLGYFRSRYSSRS